MQCTNTFGIDDDNVKNDDDDDDGDDIYIMMKFCMYVCMLHFCLFCLSPAKLTIYI